jgi:hypothetical protein
VADDWAITVTSVQIQMTQYAKASAKAPECSVRLGQVETRHEALFQSKLDPRTTVGHCLKVITLCVRKDRFSDDFMAEAFWVERS